MMKTPCVVDIILLPFKFGSKYVIVLQFEMREDMPCKVACRVKLNAEATKNFREKIDDEYRVNL